jgi:hypothetical protein
MSKASEKGERLFPKGYFARCRPSPVGDKEASATFHAVGLALTNWELAETALATLFYVLSNATEANALNAIRRAFGAIESSAGRRKAIEAAAEIYFAHDWKNKVVSEPFLGLMAAFKDASARRDEIAHGIVHGMKVNDEELGCFLYPSEYNTQRTQAWITSDADPFAFKRALYRYTSKNILEYAQKFFELHNHVWSYISSVRKIGGIPAVVLDDKWGHGAAKVAEQLIAEQKTINN